MWSRVLNAEMTEKATSDSSNPVRRGSGGSSLESLLQQACLQLQKPKLQRRSESDPRLDVSVEKRVNLDSACLGDAADGLGETYFHKIRPEANSNFLERTAPPKLETISKKTNVPRSNSGCVLGGRGSPLGTSDNSSQFSPSPTRSLSNDTQASVSGGNCDAVDFEGSSSVSADLAGQMESMIRYIDDILMNENMEDEKSLMQQTGAIHAMAKDLAGLIDPDSSVDETNNLEVVGGDYSNDWAKNEILSAEETNAVENSSVYRDLRKEIADLISSEANVLDAGGFGGDNDQSNTSTTFLPTEDNTTLKLMEGYTRMLSKHIADVSGASNSDNVDYRSFITESDDLVVHFDDRLKYYLDNLNKNPPPNSALDFKLLLRTPGERSSSSSSRVVYSSITDLLHRCAFAVSQGKTGSAADYLAELRSLSSPYGDYMQRMAHYFMEALVAKLSGTGEQLYTVITNNHPSAATMLKAYRQYVDCCPYIKLSHFFETKMTLDAFEGATRVHVVHYGIQYGVEWPSLIQHLSKRPEGPPYFRITGVDVPYPGDDPCWKIHQTGRRLAEFAKMWNVPFEFHALAGKWESFTAKDFNLRSDEVLAVTSHKMHNILDESVLGSSPRELLLRRIRSLNPKLFFIIVDNAACNGPFFHDSLSGEREALFGNLQRDGIIFS